MSKQHCRSNMQLCCLLLRQCCRFGQQCRRNVRLCRKDEISTQNSFDIVAVFGNKVERCFDIVAKNGNIVEETFDIVAFDNVASTLLLVWTGLKACILKPGPHQQQCRSNVRRCCQKRQQCRTSFALKFRPFDKVECCFDNVATVWTGL